MTNKRSPGRIMNYLNSGTTTITAGTAVVSNDTVGIAVADIAAGAVGAIDTEGEFYVTAATGAWLQGQNLYCTSAGVFTTASTGNVLCAKAWESKTTAAVVGYVKLINQA